MRRRPIRWGMGLLVLCAGIVAGASAYTVWSGNGPRVTVPLSVGEAQFNADAAAHSYIGEPSARIPKGASAPGSGSGASSHGSGNGAPQVVSAPVPLELPEMAQQARTERALRTLEGEARKWSARKRTMK